MDLHTEDRMMSFDVVSLFTKVPVDKTLEVANLHPPLQGWHTGRAHHKRAMSDVCYLTKLCMKSISTSSTKMSSLSKLKEHAAVSSLLSPVVANLCMESFKQIVLHDLSTDHQGMDLLCWQYFRAVAPQQRSPGQIPATSQQPTSIHPLLWPGEEESENKLPFLNVQVVTCDGRKATIKVYRKATHTDRHIHFISHHHPKALSGSVKCLKSRADKLCEENNWIEELNNLRRTWVNGYPSHL